MPEMMAVTMPIWAGKTLAALMRHAFTGSFTCHFAQGHLVSLEYHQGRCECCGSKRVTRVAEPK